MSSSAQSFEACAINSLKYLDDTIIHVITCILVNTPFFSGKVERGEKGGEVEVEMGGRGDGGGQGEGDWWELWGRLR